MPDSRIFVADEWEAFSSALRLKRDEASTQHAAASRALDELRSTRADTPADDEHDPEGSTSSFEWSLLVGVRNAARQELAETEAALQRIQQGTFGICAACGRPIARERLEARPTAGLCIACAAEQR